MNQGVEMKHGITKRERVTSVLCLSVAAGALLGASGFAVAQTDAAAQPVRASEVGHATRALLELQSSNTKAAPVQPMLGAEAGLAYRRYMESFKSKIPDLYGSALGTGGGSGSGGSGGAGALGATN